MCDLMGVLVFAGFCVVMVGLLMLGFYLVGKDV